MSTTTVKTQSPHTFRNSCTFQPVRQLSKNTHKPRVPVAILCQPNQHVQSVERSQGGNDSSASHSGDLQREQVKSARRVQLIAFILFCCMHDYSQSTFRKQQNEWLSSSFGAHLIVFLRTAHSSIPWTVVYIVELWLRAWKYESRNRFNVSRTNSPAVTETLQANLK